MWSFSAFVPPRSRSALAATANTEIQIVWKCESTKHTKNYKQHLTGKDRPEMLERFGFGHMYPSKTHSLRRNSSIHKHFLHFWPWLSFWGVRFDVLRNNKKAGLRSFCFTVNFPFLNASNLALPFDPIYLSFCRQNRGRQQNHSRKKTSNLSRNKEWRKRPRLQKLAQLWEAEKIAALIHVEMMSKSNLYVIFWIYPPAEPSPSGFITFLDIFGKESL